MPAVSRQNCTARRGTPPWCLIRERRSSATAATKGAEALGAHAMAYSKKSLEDGVAAAKTLSTAKSVQEAVEYQTAFAKTYLETYLAEMNKMSEIVAASVKDSMKPINERVTAFVEKVQAVR